MAPAQFLIEVVRLNTSFSLLIAFTSTSLDVESKRLWALEIITMAPAQVFIEIIRFNAPFSLLVTFALACFYIETV